jgi:hypothetical protein
VYAVVMEKHYRRWHAVERLPAGVGLALAILHPSTAVILDEPRWG